MRQSRALIKGSALPSGIDPRNWEDDSQSNCPCVEFSAAKIEARTAKLRLLDTRAILKEIIMSS